MGWCLGDVLWWGEMCGSVGAVVKCGMWELLWVICVEAELCGSTAATVTLVRCEKAVVISVGAVLRCVG